MTKISPNHLVMFLMIGGVQPAVAEAASDDMLLLHDLGIVGDSAWEAFEYLALETGIDLKHFIFKDYFPLETSWAALIIGSDSTRTSWLGRKLGRRYKHIQVRDIRRGVIDGHFDL